MTSLNVNWHSHQHGDRSRTPILFLHGFMSHGGVWRPVMDQLPDNMYSVALDLPGHGKTAADLSKLDFDNLADAIISFVNESFSGQTILCGYSMGGRIALYTALKYPDRFSMLILESTTPGIENRGDREKRLNEDRAKADKLRKSDIRTYLSDWYKLPVFSSLAKKPDLVEKLIQKKSGNEPAALAEVILRLSSGIQPSLWDKLEKWDKPALIIAGELDTKFCDIAQQMAPHFSDVKLKIIPEAGHIVHLENHKAFMAALNFFLSSRIL
jgi:2-succinyl-6-hydroxy-2,4-cyclohexadiene-1-carboxylate synthase